MRVEVAKVKYLVQLSANRGGVPGLEEDLTGVYTRLDIV